MISVLKIDIKPSKIYLTIFISFYLFNIFVAWHYFYNFLLSTIISIIISILAYFFIVKNIALTLENSIKNISLHQDYIIITKNNNSIKKYDAFELVYLSQFLLIIKINKKYIVIFKDSIINTSLSAIIRNLNIMLYGNKN
jgi:hypothetical protein